VSVLSLLLVVALGFLERRLGRVRLASVDQA